MTDVKLLLLHSNTNKFLKIDWLIEKQIKIFSLIHSVSKNL